MGTTATAEDRELVRELLARYNHAIDGRLVDEWVGLFTDDGVFDAGGRVLKGADELRGFAENLGLAGRHVVANEVIDLQGDEGTVKAYVLVFAGSPPAVAVMGAYEDEVRRVDGRWRFARRTFTPDR
ncbi:MAG: nuclear transport factor 2 family protein [Acidimicrobiia bacterium]